MDAQQTKNQIVLNKNLLTDINVFTDNEIYTVENTVLLKSKNINSRKFSIL